MTKTLATKKATTHYRNGWYADRASGGSMRCPDCRAYVGTEWLPWATPGEQRKELIAAMAVHFMSECERQ